MGRVYGRSGTAVAGDGRDQEREGGDRQAGAQGVGGLVVQDLQIRVPLGEPPPRPGALAEQARVAVERFLALTAGPR